MSTKYIANQQLGNKGEAFFESLVSEHALVHKIDRSKDMGFDFLCEWVFGESPSRLLFGVQVKTRSGLNVAERHTSKLNGLIEFQIDRPPAVRKSTLDYWKGFDFPIFLFLIEFTRGGTRVFYKRFTPILHNTIKEGEECFYLVNDANTFHAFVNRSDGRTGGFCRDLYIDHLRCQYQKGILRGIDPNNLGLRGYNSRTIFTDVVAKYRGKIEHTLDEYESFRNWY
jgi:hypothetical protein